MSNLGDYLGQLMSEVAMARMQADLETLRIAELYASHPLLKNMPVPHVRLPDVNLDVPVLIKEAQPPRAGESTRGGASRADLRKAFDDVMKGFLARAGVAVPAAVTQRLKLALDARDAIPRPPLETAVDVTGVADEYTAAALSALKEADPRVGPGAQPIASLNDAELKQEARLAFLQLRREPPRLEVIVTSAEIREGATNDNVARIRLKITEQGVEWTTIHSNGQSRDLLVPE